MNTSVGDLLRAFLYFRRLFAVPYARRVPRAIHWKEQNRDESAYCKGPARAAARGSTEGAAPVIGHIRVSNQVGTLEELVCIPSLL